MPKSKYPNQLDTSIEIPAVRDNIIEVGSDVLNSLRSAIFQIEKTLGLNPQGAVGNTVADRLNKLVDGNGNLLKEALDRSDLLSGPIADSDVSKTAAINESKLRLDFPTQILQDQVSQAIYKINSVLEAIDELVALYRAHVHPEATNRHAGVAISIESIENTSSSTGLVTLDTTTAQDAFESLFQSHINYDGSDISATNRSHEAEQVYFENEDVSAYIPSEDVQGALIDVLDSTLDQLDGHQNNFHDNSILKTTQLYTISDSEHGLAFLSEENIDYTISDSNNASLAARVNFTDTPDRPESDIQQCDIIEITTSDVTTAYQISSVNYDTTDESTVTSIDIFGRLLADSDDSSIASVYRNINQRANYAGLLASVRETPDHTNASTVQIANPDAATIITSGIKPSEITSGNKNIKLSIDGETDVEINVYDGSASEQNVDTIIKMINEGLTDDGLNALAYRVDHEELNSSEIAIVHTHVSDTTNSYTLKVSEGSDSAILSLGLTPYDGVTIGSRIGTQYFISGRAYEGLDTKLDNAGTLSLRAGTAQIETSTVNPIELGVAVGDLIAVSESDSDDGTYVITVVQDDTITVDSDQLSSGSSWDGDSSATTRFRIYKNSISLNDLAFAKVTAASKCALVDIFMTGDRDIIYNPILEYPAEGMTGSYASNNIISIVDCVGGAEDKTLTMSVTDASADSSGLPKISLDDGPPVILDSIKDTYLEVYSGAYDIKLKLFVEDSDAIAARLIDSGEYSYEIYGKAEINKEENLFIARVPYESAEDRVTGHGNHLPRIFPKIRRGAVGYKDLGSDVIDNVLQKPIGEMRSNGVTVGLELSPSSAATTSGHDYIATDGLYSIDISAGVCYVKGKRFDFDGVTDLVTDLLSPLSSSSGTTDNVFVAIDEWGNIVFKSATTSSSSGASCASPFSPDNFCIIGVLECDGTTVRAIDLRVFIDHLDNKLLNSITVSPVKGMGHFDDFGKAVKYAKRFSKVYSGAGVPTIHLKSGTHKVIVEMDGTSTGTSNSDYRQESLESGMWINFPVNITGEGHSTVLDIIASYSDLGADDDERINSGDQPQHGRLYIVGPGVVSTPDGDNDIITNGFVNLSNFRMRLCHIRISDASLEDSSSNVHNFGVNINNVTFDNSEKDGFSSFNFGVVLSRINSSDDIGNVTISNCQFLNSVIASFSGITAAKLKNITLSNNAFRGNGETTAPDYAMHVGGAGHIFDFNDAPPENNIEWRGNIITNSSGTPDASGSHLWGDRISNNLFVGNKVGIGTSIFDIDDDVTLHIKAGDSGVINSGISTADDVIIENSGHVGVMLLCPDANYSQINFGTPTLHRNSYIRGNYNSASPQLTLATNHSSGKVRFKTADEVVALTLDSDQNATLVGQVSINGAEMGNTTRAISSIGRVAIADNESTSGWTASGTLGSDTNVAIEGRVGIGEEDAEAMLHVVSTASGASGSLKVGPPTDDDPFCRIYGDRRLGDGVALLSVESSTSSSPYMLKVFDSSGSFIQTGEFQFLVFSFSGTWLGNGRTASHYLICGDVGNSNPFRIVNVADAPLEIGDMMNEHGVVALGGITSETNNFTIDHPDPAKTDDYWLKHSAVESPTTGDNLYRWTKELTSGDNSLELPDYFNLLNKDAMVWVSPAGHFGAGYGDVNDNIATITVNEPGKYNILIIGTRKDEAAERLWKGVERAKTEPEKEKAKQRKAAIAMRDAERAMKESNNA